MPGLSLYFSLRERLRVNWQCRVWQRSLDVHALALAAALALALLAAGLQPDEARASRSPTSAQERAQRLAAAGNHAEAAQAYADLAAQSPADHDNYELLSAEQWVLANNIGAAKQAFAAVSPEARTSMPASRALVAAEIALAERDGATAIHELDTIPVPTSPQLAQSYWWLRGKAAFLTGHPVEGTRAFVERERYIADPQSPAREPRGAARAAARRGPARRIAEGPAENRSASSPGGSRSARSPSRWRAIPCAPRRRSPIGSAHSRSIPAPNPDSRSRGPSGPRFAVRRQISAPSLPGFPNRSRCCCRYRAAPRASASPCATASSPLICSRIRPPVRCSKSTTPPPSPWPAPTGMPSMTARRSWWVRSPRRMSLRWCRCAPPGRPSSRSIFSPTR